MKIKKNDNVMVITGKDKGKSGKVMRALPKELAIVVDKINIVKKHTKPTQSLPQGGILEMERPLAISKVMLVCPHCNKATRVGHTLSQNGKNVRICKKCNQLID